MKILWFANTPCLAAEKLDTNFNGGGWLYSLNKYLDASKEINLSICFYWPTYIKPFQYKNTWFYPVLKKKSTTKIGRIATRILSPDYDTEELQELLKIIENVNPNVIHVHGSENNFGLIQNHTSIPVVISIQGILSPYSEKFFSGIPKAIAKKNESFFQKLKCTTTKVAYKQMVKNATRERLILKHTRYVIGRTDWDKRVSLLLAPNSQYFIGNEMLRDTFYKTKWEKKGSSTPIKLVTTTSGGLYKGFETIVKIAQLLKKNNTIQFEWNIIGLSELNPIVKIVKKWLSINFKLININLLGAKNEEELAEILIDSDIYCQVSHIENSPNSLCEAMIIGMPIIATFAGGTSSLLTDKQEGLLVQDGEPYAYAGAIIELANDFEFAKKIAIMAQKRALERHNKQQITKMLLKTYEKIIQRK